MLIWCERLYLAQLVQLWLINCPSNDHGYMYSNWKLNSKRVVKESIYFSLYFSKKCTIKSHLHSCFANMCRHVLLSYSRIINIAISNIVICVDSKSVLQTLQSWDCRARADLVFEIKHLIHILQTRNTLITFLWIPSHCNIYWNDKVDEQKVTKQLVKIQNVY